MDVMPAAFIAALLAVLAQTTFGAHMLPFGTSEGDQRIGFSKYPSATVLRVPIEYCKSVHTELYISSQGVVTFDSPLPGPRAELDLKNTSSVALFFSPANGGKVYYRTGDRDTQLSKEVSAVVRKAFLDSPDFQSENTVLVTWEDLRSDQLEGSNEFQLAMASDTTSSYALLSYAKVDWTQSGGRLAEAGFFCGDGQSKKLAHSGTAQMSQLPRLSNLGDNGTFIYRLSGMDDLLNSSGACAAGRNICTQPDMTCVTTDVSYRCECTPGFRRQAATNAATGFRCASSKSRLRCGSGNVHMRSNETSSRVCRHRRHKHKNSPVFEDPPKAVTDSQRLWTPRKAGYASAEETYAKECSSPHNGMSHLGACVANSCVLQAVAKFIANAGCWHQDLKECVQNTHVQCPSPEARLVHNLLTKPNGLAEYMAAHNLVPGDFQSELKVIGKMMILLSRANVLDGSLNPFGAKFSLETRHQVQGHKQAFTYLPFQPVMRESAHGTDFSYGNELLDAVFAGSEDKYFPTSRFSDEFLSFLKLPPGESASYYKGKNMAFHAQLKGRGREAIRIPRHITRLMFRFDWLVFGTKVRTVPLSFEGSGKRFQLHATIAVTEDTEHLYAYAIKWKSRTHHECWLLDSQKEPELLTGGAKKRCEKERIMWCIYAVRGPRMDS